MEKKQIAIRISNMQEVQALEKHFKLTYCGFGRQLTWFVPDANTYRTPDLDTFDNYDFMSFKDGVDRYNIELPKDEVVIELANGNIISTVTAKSVLFNFERTTGLLITASELNEIYTAYKSL